MLQDLARYYGEIGIGGGLQAELGPLPAEVSGDPARPCLRPIIMASGDGCARVCLMPEGALLLAGDAIRLEVTLGPGVHLEREAI